MVKEKFARGEVHTHHIIRAAALGGYAIALRRRFRAFDFEAVHKAVEAADIATESAELTALPELTAPLASESELEKVNRLVDLLDDHDDVQEVFSNAEFDG